ncbi:hypothetical protein H9P43_007208 [Blastocladiella emersonii ATCC 22665]|nr:hypothetical protein H9P43_007208 [Blastocladiella emersonii ATCC 22665]
MLNACIPPHHRAEAEAEVAQIDGLLALPSDLIADVVILATPRACVVTACRDFRGSLKSKRAKLAWINAQCTLITPPATVRVYRQTLNMSVRTNLIAHLEQCCISRWAPDDISDDEVKPIWPVDSNPDYTAFLTVTALIALLDSVPAVFLTPTRPEVVATDKYFKQIHAAMERQVRAASTTSAPAAASKVTSTASEPAAASTAASTPAAAGLKKMPLFTSVPLVGVIQILVYAAFHYDAAAFYAVAALALSRASAFFCVAPPLLTWSRATVKSINEQWEREMQCCSHLDRRIRFTAYLGLAALSRWDADKFALVTEGELSTDKGELTDLLRQDNFLLLALADLAHLDRVRADNVIRILDWLIAHTGSKAGGGPRRAIGGIPIHVFFIAPRLRPVFDHLARHPMLVPAEQKSQPQSTNQPQPQPQQKPAVAATRPTGPRPATRPAPAPRPATAAARVASTATGAPGASADASTPAAPTTSRPASHPATSAAQASLPPTPTASAPVSTGAPGPSARVSASTAQAASRPATDINVSSLKAALPGLRGMFN